MNDKQKMIRLVALTSWMDTQFNQSPNGILSANQLADLASTKISACKDDYKPESWPVLFDAIAMEMSDETFYKEFNCSAEKLASLESNSLFTNALKSNSDIGELVSIFNTTK